MKHKYAIVTPTKNDEAMLCITADSVLSQEIKPERWIIINDGSTDRTGELIQGLGEENPWIAGIDNPEQNRSLSRRIGGQAVIHLGLEKIKPEEYDFIVRMDGDVSFESAFFKNMFKKFEQNPRLGIASGVCFVQEKGKLIEEKNPSFHTRGPLKIYRSACYRDIGGLDREEGWDTIDEVRANMMGWQTRNFPDLKVVHLRKTQTASGTLRGFRNVGSTAYYTGYHPLFMLVRLVYRMFSKPFIIGSVHMFLGFVEGYLKKSPRVNDPALIQYMRRQQMNKLIGRETIWK